METTESDRLKVLLFNRKQRLYKITEKVIVVSKPNDDDEEEFSDSAMNPNDYCPKCGKKSMWEGHCGNGRCQHGYEMSGFGG